MFNPKENNLLDEQLAVSGMEMNIELFTAISGIGSIFSAIMGASSQSAAASHNKEQVKAQRKYQKKLGDLKLQEAMDAHKYQQDTFDITVANYQQEREYQEKLMTDQWIQAVNIQNKGYNDAVDAYNKSVEAFDQQIDFNRISADVAKRDAQRVRQETYDSLAFEAEGLRLDMEENREDRRLQKRNLRFERKQTLRRHKHKKAEIKRDLDVARDNFNNAQAELTALTDSARAETAEKLRVQRYQSLIEEGKFRSKGMAGRSALKAQRSMAAQDAFAQQAIVDALMRNDRMSNIEKQKLVDNINHQRKTAKGTMKLIHAVIREETEKRNAERIGIGLKTLQENRRMGFNLEQLEKSRQSADGQWKAELTQIGLDKYAANIAAQNNLLNKPDRPKPLPRPVMPPEPIFQEPLNPDFEAIAKLNKQAKDAIPEPYVPSGLATWGTAIGQIADATRQLQSRTAPNPLNQQQNNQGLQTQQIQQYM